MRNRFVIVALLLFVGVGCALGAQGRGAQSGPAEAAGPLQAHGNLLQVMRGILFPASNVIFAAQDDPTTVEPAFDPSTSPNPLNSAYGGWQAVENAAIAIAESANLLQIPHNCSNGRPAPVANADWQEFVEGLRAAGMSAFKAAQSRNVDNIVDVAGEVTVACGNCHDVYREKTPEQGGPANRCTAS